MQFVLPSSDPMALDRARRTAISYAREKTDAHTVGIAFLGSIARGYFDQDADIDISIFQTGIGKKYDVSYEKRDGFEVHTFTLDYEAERAEAWETGKRWAYATHEIFYDPEGRLQNLLDEKVPLTPEERSWNLIFGFTLAEWHVNRLTDLWVRRGSLLSAHYMIGEGINLLLKALFALNDQLLADFKWRLYCAERLTIQPPMFSEMLRQCMITEAFTERELQRRKAAFMGMWHAMLPLIEKEVGMRYEVFKEMV